MNYLHDLEVYLKCKNYAKSSIDYNINFFKPKKTKMKATITETEDKWTLNIETYKGGRKIFLGDASQFCGRVLGMSYMNVVRSAEMDGMNDSDSEDDNLGNWIIKYLGINAHNLHLHEDWLFNPNNSAND